MFQADGCGPFGSCPILQTFGFATEEFEVTADRLGVYLPVVSLFITNS